MGNSKTYNKLYHILVFIFLKKILNNLKSLIDCDTKKYETSHHIDAYFPKNKG